MKNRKKESRGNSCRRPTAKEGSTTGQGASPERKEHHVDGKRKLLPVPVEVAFRRVRADTKIAYVMECLTDTTEFVAMPFLSRRSGSLVVHSVIARIRRRFRWVIENEIERSGSGELHSRYRLVAPAPTLER